MAVDLTQYVSPLVRQRPTYTPSQIAQATPPPDFSAASPALQQYYQRRGLTPFGASTIPATAGTTGTSPTSTQITYGFGNDQFLTSSQQKIADSVQHAFSQSLAQRDREMQRYQMPQLASFEEDEALARAIATANLANQQTNPYGITTGGRGGGGGGRGGGGGGGGGGYRLPAGYNPYGMARPPIGPDAGKSWQSLLSGASSLLPLIFGKDAFGNFMNKGVVGWIKDQFGNNIPVDASGQPVFDQATVYGANSGWGQDIYNPSTGIYDVPVNDFGIEPATSDNFYVPPADNWDLMGNAGSYGFPVDNWDLMGDYYPTDLGDFYG